MARQISKRVATLEESATFALADKVKSLKEKVT